MDYIVVEHVIYHGAKSLCKVTTLFACSSKQFTEHFEIGIRVWKLQFRAVNGKDVVVVPKVSLTGIFVKNINGEIEQVNEKGGLYSLTGFRNRLL